MPEATRRNAQTWEIHSGLEEIAASQRAAYPANAPYGTQGGGQTAAAKRDGCRMPTILLPLDGTPEAEVALVGVQALTRNLPHTMRLLYVGDDPDDAHATYLERIGKLLADLGHTPSVQVLLGDPADVILSVAMSLPADLVILKRDEREGVKGWVLGSITDRVARQIRGPLLLMNPLPNDDRWLNYTIRQILVPLDGSASAESALDAAVPLAERLGARISVIYSTPWLNPSMAAVPEFYMAGSVSPEVDRQIEADMRAYLEGVVDRYRDRVQPERIAMRGAAADAVLAAAEKHMVDLVMMTTQGAGGIVHRSLGRVADAVTQASGVPVMLIRPEAG